MTEAIIYIFQTTSTRYLHAKLPGSKQYHLSLRLCSNQFLDAWEDIYTRPQSSGKMPRSQVRTRLSFHESPRHSVCTCTLSLYSFNKLCLTSLEFILTRVHSFPKWSFSRSCHLLGQHSVIPQGDYFLFLPLTVLPFKNCQSKITIKRNIISLRFYCFSVTLSLWKALESPTRLVKTVCWAPPWFWLCRYTVGLAWEISFSKKFSGRLGCWFRVSKLITIVLEALKL